MNRDAVRALLPRRKSWPFTAHTVLAGILVGLVAMQVGTRQAAAQSSSITFVQNEYSVPQTPQLSVTVAYAIRQTAGNLNVVVVGWNDSTAHVQSVTDTKGNAYLRAVGPTVVENAASQAIYYAKNIQAAAANANAVTVVFDQPASFPDIRIAEYRSIDPVNALDVAVGATGNNGLSDSGTIATTSANDLLVGANLVATSTTGPGAGYTPRVITSTDGDILEDRVVTSTGSYSATALVSPGFWIMQMVAFRAGFSISPRTVALTLNQPQQFTTNLGAAGMIWSVDGVMGGSPSSGTISPTGLYVSPNNTGTHTVTVTTSDQSSSSSATVYITNYTGTFTHHNDNFRSGQNLNEMILTPANVNPATFGKLRSYTLDGIVQGSPLYVAVVNIPGQGIHNIVYVATEHDTVYAFDADGVNNSPFWRVSFINPATGVTTVPSNDTGECCDITPEIGITGTPVIDQASGTLYVVAKTKEVSGGTTNYVQRLHALDLATAAEKFGGPVLIQASVPGTGSGARGGFIAFDALYQNQRPALLLRSGVVYIGFASHGDNGPWHGWVLGYNAATLQQLVAYNYTANGVGGGIWQSGGGLAADSAGNTYFVTGNGTFDADVGNGDFGDSFVKISTSGAVLDYFTPHDQAYLGDNNIDLGAGGLLLLPDQPGGHPHLLVSAGKNGTIYLLDRDNMGHYNPNNDNQIVQSLVNIFPMGTPEPGNFSAPVYFNGYVYFSPIADHLQAFQLNSGLLSTAPTSQSSEVYNYPGGALAISANGNSNGILWAVQSNDEVAGGILRAYDATNLGSELYGSDQVESRDGLDFAAKFSIPLVANGKVFVGSVSQLTLFGLFP